MIELYNSKLDLKISTLKFGSGKGPVFWCFSQVQKSYAQTLKARDSGHAVLRDTWRQSVDLIGELAAVLVDGEIFKIFVAVKNGGVTALGTVSLWPKKCGHVKFVGTC